MAKVKVLVGVVASGFDCKAGGEYDLTEEDAPCLFAWAKQCRLKQSAKKQRVEKMLPKLQRRGK